MRFHIHRNITILPKSSMEELTMNFGLKILSRIGLHPLRYRLRDKLFTAFWFTFSLLNFITCCIGVKDVQLSNVPLLARKMEGVQIHNQVRKVILF